MPGSHAFSASQRPWTPPCCRGSTEKPMPRNRRSTLPARQADQPPPKHVPIIQITTCQPGSRTCPLRRIEPRSRARPCPVVRHGPRRPPSGPSANHDSGRPSIRASVLTRPAHTPFTSARLPYALPLVLRNRGRCRPGAVRWHAAHLPIGSPPPPDRPSVRTGATHSRAKRLHAFPGTVVPCRKEGPVLNPGLPTPAAHTARRGAPGIIDRPRDLNGLPRLHRCKATTPEPRLPCANQGDSSPGGTDFRSVRSGPA